MDSAQSAAGSGRGKILRCGKTLALCAAAALGNALLSIFVSGAAKIPLYLDTVFTIAVCFSLGILPAVFTGLVLGSVFTHLAYHYLPGASAGTAWIANIFSLCVLAEIALIAVFRGKIKSPEAAFLKKPSIALFTGIAARLLTLAALDCIVISVMGGVIDSLITALSAPRIFFPEDTFKLGLLRNNMPVPAAAILSRIPINIVDRFIAVFCGYGLSLLYRGPRRRQ